MKKSASILLLMLLLVVACSKTAQQDLSFSVLDQSSSFVEVSQPRQGAPSIIIIASQDEITPPISEYRFSDEVVEKLNNINFDNSFAILFSVGPIPENGIIDNISREKDRVVIHVKNYTVGPGVYKLEGYSLPYQLISVEKSNKWDQEIEFSIVDENGNLIGKASHSIP